MKWDVVLNAMLSAAPTEANYECVFTLRFSFGILLKTAKNRNVFLVELAILIQRMEFFIFCGFFFANPRGVTAERGTRPKLSLENLA